MQHMAAHQLGKELSEEIADITSFLRALTGKLPKNIAAPLRHFQASKPFY